MSSIQPAAVGSFQIGGEALTVIAGPCLAESLPLCRQVAESMANLCREFGFNYVFKASFDKANRSSGSTQRGVGMEAGLKILLYKNPERN